MWIHKEIINFSRVERKFIEKDSCFFFFSEEEEDFGLKFYQD